MALELNTSTHRVTLFLDQNPLKAQVEDANSNVTTFTDREITYGILGNLPHQNLIETIQRVGLQKIHAVVYQNPKELVFFEAEKAAAPLIKKGKEHLREDSEDRFGVYEKALNMLGQALKIQQKMQGAVEDLKGAIFHLTRKLNVLKCQQGASLYLAVPEVRALKEVIDIYKDEESIFETLQTFLEVQDPLEPHHHFLWAVIHEAIGEYLKALECYLVLSEDPIRAATCIEKAHLLFKLATKGNPSLLIQKESIQMTFQAYLQKLNRLSPQQKNPTCFICFSVNEEDVSCWLENTFVPDMDEAGIKPIFFFRDLDQGSNLHRFQELARTSDTVVVACTEALKKECDERKKAPVGVALQIDMIRNRIGNKDKSGTTFPIYLKGSRHESLPIAYLESIFGSKIDLLTNSESIEFNYFSNIFELFGSIRGIPREIARKERENFLYEIKRILKGDFNPEEVVSWKKAREQKQKALLERISARIVSSIHVLNMPRPDKFFIGRQKELAKLHEKCSHHGRVVISGMGGVGKTALALSYANDYKTYYQWIHFVPSSTIKTIVSGLLKLADDLLIPKSDQRLYFLKDNLEKLESEHLLIFDGVNSPETFKEIQKYLPNNGKCTLITSIFQEGWKRLNFERIKLNLLGEQDSIDFLCRAIPSSNLEAAKQLAQKLEFLPLALTHATSYIREQNCSIAKYLELFEKYEVSLFENQFLRLKQEPKTVLTTLQHVMSIIEAQENALVAKPLINFISFLAPSNIPYEALSLWQKNMSVDELESRRTLGILNNYSMLEKQGEVYKIHPLLQSMIRHGLKPEEKQTILNHAIQVFNTIRAQPIFQNKASKEFADIVLFNCEAVKRYYDQYDFNKP